MMGMEVKVIPFVMAWDGQVTEFNKNYRGVLGITPEIFGYIQTICLNNTLECLRYKGDIIDL